MGSAESETENWGEVDVAGDGNEAVVEVTADVGGGAEGGCVTGGEDVTVGVGGIGVAAAEGAVGEAPGMVVGPDEAVDAGIVAPSRGIDSWGEPVEDVASASAE